MFSVYRIYWYSTTGCVYICTDVGQSDPCAIWTQRQKTKYLYYFCKSIYKIITFKLHKKWTISYLPLCIWTGSMACINDDIWWNILILIWWYAYYYTVIFLPNPHDNNNISCQMLKRITTATVSPSPFLCISALSHCLSLSLFVSLYLSRPLYIHIYTYVMQGLQQPLKSSLSPDISNLNVIYKLHIIMLSLLIHLAM